MTAKYSTVAYFPVTFGRGRFAQSDRAAVAQVGKTHFGPFRLSQNRFGRAVHALAALQSRTRVAGAAPAAARRALYDSMRGEMAAPGALSPQTSRV